MEKINLILRAEELKKQIEQMEKIGQERFQEELKFSFEPVKVGV